MKPVIEIITAAYPSDTEPHRAHFIEDLALMLMPDFDIEIIAPRVYESDPFFEERKGIPVQRFRFQSGGRILKANRKPGIEVMTGYAKNAIRMD